MWFCWAAEWGGSASHGGPERAHHDRGGAAGGWGGLEHAGIGVHPSQPSALSRVWLCAARHASGGGTPSGGTRLTRRPLTAVGVACGAQGGSTPLHLAAGGGHILIVEKLLAAGAGANIPNEVRTSAQGRDKPSDGTRLIRCSLRGFEGRVFWFAEWEDCHSVGVHRRTQGDCGGAAVCRGWGD